MGLYLFLVANGKFSLCQSGTIRVYLIQLRFPGEVAEWLKAAASKAVVRFYRTVGSNPTLSAIPSHRYTSKFLSLRTIIFKRFCANPITKSPDLH